MRLIPVLDVQNGVAVHARGGHRNDYRPLSSTLPRPSTKTGSAPDLTDVALAFRDRLGLQELYLADLDAIRSSQFNRKLYQAVRDFGVKLWLDAGIASVVNAIDLQGAADVLILGLETLPGPEILAQIVRSINPSSLAFSLDLREGQPILAENSQWPEANPLALLDAVIQAGIERVILLDLARVGMNQGMGTEDLLEAGVHRYPHVEWVVGGGISSVEQFQRAASLGASAALVGSALHDGRIGAVEVAALTSAGS